MAKVVRAMIGMSNRRDGGYIVIGVDDQRGLIQPVGLSAADLVTWTYDGIADFVAEHAEPAIEFEVATVELDGKSYVLIQVMEFAEVPVLCSRDLSEGSVSILRQGACYIRPRRKPETVEIRTYADMRDLFDLATEKGVRRFFATARRAGVEATPEVTSQALFDAQISDFV
jgi:predicted HTH transcriptional regulator